MRGVSTRQNKRNADGEVCYMDPAFPGKKSIPRKESGHCSRPALPLFSTHFAEEFSLVHIAQMRSLLTEASPLFSSGQTTPMLAVAIRNRIERRPLGAFQVPLSACLEQWQVSRSQVMVAESRALLRRAVWRRYVMSRAHLLRVATYRYS